MLPLSSVEGEAYQYLATYKNRKSRPIRLAEHKNIKWKPPSPGMYKKNFDGAGFEDSGEVGIWVIIRNSRGEIVASQAEKILNPLRLWNFLQLVELYTGTGARLRKLHLWRWIWNSHKLPPKRWLANVNYRSFGTRHFVLCIRSWSFSHIGR